MTRRGQEEKNSYEERKGKALGDAEMGYRVY